MRWSRIVAALPFVLLLGIPAANLVSAQPDSQRRRERPDDAFMPAPRGGPTSPPAVVVAGPFVSVQVNLDVNGNNIVAKARVAVQFGASFSSARMRR